MNACPDCGEWERDCTCCPHDETDHGICLSCGRQTDMNAHDYGKSYAPVMDIHATNGESPRGDSLCSSGSARPTAGPAMWAQVTCETCKRLMSGPSGPRGLALGDYEHPVFDGPQPRARPAPMRVNTEGDE